MGLLEGKVALVTGGGAGIGRAIAVAFVAAGAHVIVGGRREAPLRELSQAHPGKIDFVQMDLGNWKDHEKTLKAVTDRHGRLDVLVNNAYAHVTKPFVEQTPEEIVNQIHVVLTSTTLLIHQAIPLLRHTKGNIVNISSAMARYVAHDCPGDGVYAAAKAGLNQLTRVLANELGQYGIRVNAVAPGFTRTDGAAGAFEYPEAVKALVAATPLGRPGEPEDVAHPIVFMASDMAGWVTGQVLDATGGFWMSS
jgi:NAD(P)-dependent dehydrogenase (short-subunit alcohol dehydrogenase family)